MYCPLAKIELGLILWSSVLIKFMSAVNCANAEMLKVKMLKNSRVVFMKISFVFFKDKNILIIYILYQVPSFWFNNQLFNTNRNDE